MRTTAVFRVALAGVLGICAESTPARACGGTFCDTGPVAMPVDQTGENILFIIEDGRVEAHVQIQYQGEAERFAWVIPVPKLPKFEVGSELLFRALLAGSVPAYGFNTSVDVCESSGDTSASGGGGFGGSGGQTGVNVVQRSQAGAFEIVVLDGGTAQQVSQWLNDNGYQNADMAPAILQEYVQQQFLFAAVKLKGGTGVDEIHPLVFSYTGSEPCVPIKLTAVAATDDMSVRTFFLGKGRVVPSNYKHMTLNPVRIDWQARGANYMEVVSRAADSPVANGQAFVTEYAGSSAVVDPSGVYATSWNASKLSTIEPSALIPELQVQGLASCNTGFCQFNHPLLLPLLQQHLPRPAGVTDEEFYSCVSCYEDLIDLTLFDPVKLAEDFDERIVRPGQRAAGLLATYPYLTRMLTTMSASEMTIDPMFHKRVDLPDVPLPGLAQRRILCSGMEVFTLPGGQEVAIPPGGSWPAWDSSMPYAATIEEIPAQGEPIVLVNNDKAIKTELVGHNLRTGWPEREMASCLCSAPGRKHGSSDSPWLAFGLGVGLLALRRRR